MNPNDRQVGGTHYASEYQHWDFVWDARIPYLQAMVIKYVSRWRRKNGIEDLEKAKHFLEKFLSRLDGQTHSDWSDNYDAAERYVRANRLWHLEARIVRALATWAPATGADAVAIVQGAIGDVDRLLDYARTAVVLKCGFDKLCDPESAAKP